MTGLGAVFGLLACGGEPAVVDSAPVSDTAPPLVTGECPPENTYEAAARRAAHTLEGGGTWTLSFDEAAHALGHEDCTYHRVYPALVEAPGHRWQCPDCLWFAGGDATVDVGYDDCFLQVSTSDQTRTEHLGVQDVGGTPHLMRAGAHNTTLKDLSPLSGSGDAADPFLAGWVDTGALSDGAAFTLTASLSLIAGEDAGVSIDDVDANRAKPYACGWPTCNPGGPTPSYTLSTGGILPNARFADTCGEGVDLWDFWGRYLVIDASSPNCGPCQEMARHEGAWVTEMAARGIEVEWITLLNLSLSAVNEPAGPEDLTDWATTFATTGPVLADEGYAYDLFPAYRGDDNLSFPTVLVVNPDMQVLGWSSGFTTEENGGTGFTNLEALIDADNASR